MKLFKSVVKKLLPKTLTFSIRLFINRRKYAGLINQVQNHYFEIEKKLKERKNEKLRVAAYVVFDSSFAAYDLFDLLFADADNYSAKIVIIPDTSRGDEHQKRQYIQTRDFFVNKYGSENVLDGYEFESGKINDYSELFDVIYLANPYDAMVSDVHGVKYLSTRNCLPVYLSYGCMPDNYGCKIIMPMVEISLFWKVFADNKMSFDDYKKYELCRGQNVVLSGYAKMDSLIKFSEVSVDRKRIIIAPHHTIKNTELPLSNFLEYKEFFLQLPKIFPQIDFIFRPHPLLFTNMVNEGYWTQEDVIEYIEMIKKAGMVYSVGGDYFDIFVNSDAMIHDCSSFVVEYLFTGKPCCFMAKKNYKKVFSTLGKSCLENYYLAFNQQQITDFIEHVIINGNDSKNEKRVMYTKNNLAINYPEVSKEILKEITLG